MRITPTEASLHHELAVMQTRVKDIADELVVLKERHAKLVEAARSARDLIYQLHWVSVEYPNRGCEVMSTDLHRIGEDIRKALESEVSDGD